MEEGDRRGSGDIREEVVEGEDSRVEGGKAEGSGRLEEEGTGGIQDSRTDCDLQKEVKAAGSVRKLRIVTSDCGKLQSATRQRSVSGVAGAAPPERAGLREESSQLQATYSSREGGWNALRLTLTSFDQAEILPPTTFNRTDRDSSAMKLDCSLPMNSLKSSC